MSNGRLKNDDSGRCLATTDAGHQCTLSRLSGCRYCGRHLREIVRKTKQMHEKFGDRWAEYQPLEYV